MGMEVGRVQIQSSKIELHGEPSTEKPAAEPESNPQTAELIADTFKLKTIDDKKLNEIVEKLNRVFDVLGTELKFKVHNDTKEIVVQVVEANSGKVLKEIPPEKILNMIAQMMKTVGVLVDEKA